MINIKHLIKVGIAWMSILYALCFASVALFPVLRVNFMRYSLHADVSMGASHLTLSSFVVGLIFWDIITVISFWLFAVLFNKIKR